MIKPKENQLFSDDLQDKYIDLLNNVKKLRYQKNTYIFLNNLKMISVADIMPGGIY